MRLTVLALSLALASFASLADTTSAGHTYTPPDSFAVQQDGPVLRVTAPEGDLSVYIVELDQAQDAADAVKQAWAKVQPDFARKLELATPRANRNGWVDQQGFDYETSPSEKTVVQAVARRPAKGSGWVVILVQGSQATLGVRGAPIGKFLSSLRPKGYERESFAGRTPKPLTPERIEALKAFVADGMKQLDVPGVGLSFIDGGKVVWQGGLGVRELGKPAPVDADTLFMAASNTKSMTTALLAKAVDAGKLKWEQPAAEAYPGFRLADAEITKQVQIRHLVCACTGMPRQDMEMIFSNGKAPAASTFAQLGQMKPTSKFGEVFQYSNLMVGAGGYIAAHALKPQLEVGAAYDQAMDEQLFKPLGMTSTTFDMAKALRGNHAEPHGEALDGATRHTGLAFNQSIHPSRPAGGVWTSPRDLTRWVLMELSKGRNAEGRAVISEANWAARYAPQVMVGEDRSYGMGLFIDKSSGVTIASHGGDLPGYHSNMVWLPEFGIGMTILTNSDAGYLLRGPLQRKMLEILFDGKPEAEETIRVAAQSRKIEAEKARELLIQPVPAAAQAKLVARYANKDLGPIAVRRAKDGKLHFQFGHWGSEMALKKNEDGSETYISVDAGLGGIELTRDDKAKAPTLVLRDAQHEYRFTAVR